MEWEGIGLICFVVAMVQMFTMNVLNIYDLHVHIYILGLPIFIFVLIKILNWIGNKYDKNPEKLDGVKE